MRVLTLLVLAWIGTGLGCASPRERLYTLSGSEPPAVVTDPTLHVVLGPVTIPAAVDRPQLVIRTSAVRLVALEQERWAEPLREAVPRVLAESMRSQLRDASVTSLMTVAPPADMRVVVEVSRFEAIAGQEVIIEAHWWLHSDSKSGPAGTSVARVTIRSGPQDYDAVVAAEAAGLVQVGADLSRAIEKEAVR
jgi:uncharacterized lipoprotein YmbA